MRASRPLLPYSFLLSLVSLCAIASPSYGQPIEDDSQTRTYIRINAASFLGAAFPSSFNAYTADGPAAYNSYYTYEFANPSASLGFGIGIGSQVRIGSILLSGDLEYTRSTHPDNQETLIEDMYDSQTFSQQTIITQFQQSGRANSAIIGTFSFGLFLNAENNFSLYFSAGLGYGWQSYASEATKYAQTRGYNIKTIEGSTTYDSGEYNGNGKFTRGSMLYVIGVGSEVVVAPSIGLRLEYRYAGSSYTRENVLISSGAVNIYQSEAVYDYTFANILTGGISYYF